MSKEPTYVPDAIDQLASDFFDEQRERPLPNKFMALARNATAVTHEDLDAVVQPNVVPYVDSLEQDGCEYIDGLYFALSRCECPAAAREFVALVCGISGGRAGVEIEITDPELAQRAGVSESTIGYRRRVYKGWAQGSLFRPIGIIEGDFDTEAGKNRPTKYTVEIVPVVAEIVKRARAKTLYDKSRKGALREAAAEFHTRALAEATEEMIGDLPIPDLKDRKAKGEREPKDQIKSNTKTLGTIFEKTCFLLVRQGDPELTAEQVLNRYFVELFDDFQNRVGEVMKSHDMGWGWSEFDRERKRRKKQSEGGSNA